MQASDLVHCSLCYPLFKSPQILLCYLSVACSQFLACFTVQFSRCSSPTLFKVRFKHLDQMLEHFNPILVEISGIEPLASCLQGRCSPRTELTPTSYLISRALLVVGPLVDSNHRPPAISVARSSQLSYGPISGAYTL